ncbi:hypothetical protein SPRG_09174 [Saprolegnia parasitica CBS 223.65]|uniref:Uncharacterized protein n=1 Tax=Saprolegnia parasitica (strain CBS 223.65) TaxID=695850 RepID=A0A067C3J2_SAPPC|nr:hypothetical protein SPRG_09174 [Saprolegnia parasitica CBS 223.65]KDO25349.1 hypothetical protein SPRG_09174 [Saprolegnia parasitica CBS 223.65]|eukprot:XP_012203998.1 hypothetical protein SPRG_09174 [Saprolegnia parasitica CBS 223.65]
MTTADKGGHLRTLRRLKQQRRRARDLDEQKDLEQQLYVLQHFLAKYKAHADTTLPWKQMASALNDAVDDATSINMMLRQQVDRLVKLGHGLAFWEASEPFTWQQVWLPIDPIARCTNLDWFTQRFFHNTDWMLARTFFPSSSLRVMDHVEIDHGNDLLDIGDRMQIDIALPLDDTHIPVTVLDPALVASIDPNMRFQRVDVPGEVSYFVMREFATPNRFVFVIDNVCQLNDDPSVWCPRLSWYTLDRVRPNTIRLRALIYNGPYVKERSRKTWRDALSSFDAHADAITEAAKWAAFQQFLDHGAHIALDHDRRMMGLHLFPTM